MNSFILLLVIAISEGNCRYVDTDDDNGGHSSEFKAFDHEWKMEELNRSPGRSCMLRNKKLMQKPEDKAFFATLPKVLNKLKYDLQSTLEKSHLNGVVTGRIKNTTSLLEKMKQESIKNYREITDIVGLRVTLQTLDDIITFKQSYLKLFNKDINEIRCYGVCGPAVYNNDPRMKTYWPWRGSGYRRLHFKVTIPELKKSAEIQVGTPYMTLWADWEHSVVYKGPGNLKQNSEVLSYSQRLAQYYMILDEMRNKMSPRCPYLLKEMEGKGVFSPNEWKIFGFPPNACNFWNDLSVNMS